MYACCVCANNVVGSGVSVHIQHAQNVTYMEDPNAYESHYTVQTMFS